MMAGDWIKLEATTPDKPEVHALAQALGLPRDEVLGKLVRLFIWYDQHLASGNARGVTEVTVNSIIGHASFANAMRAVGWLNGSNEAVEIANFERHNGETAKKRALNSRRQADFRNARVAPRALPREEKRREEKNKTKGGSFAPPAWLPMEAWQAYNDMRAKIRKPLTDRARELAVAKLTHLRNLGHDPAGVLEQSVLNGWAGLFELKPEAQAPAGRVTSKTCRYCEKPWAGIHDGIPHCNDHSADAMARKPAPK